MQRSGGMTVTSAILASGAVALGSIAQGTVGFGVGVLAAPLLLLIDPRLVPGPLLLTAFFLIVALTWREWRGVRFADLGWSLVGRVAGTAVAVLFLGGIPAGGFDAVLGVVVIVAVAFSAIGLEIRLSRPAFFGAGALSGFFGTVAAVGGPPMGLLYQREKGPVVRGTLSAFFVVGTVISLAGLAVAGRFGPSEIRLTPVLLPGALVGFLLSGRLARFLDRGWMRPAILGVSVVSGCIVVVKHFV
jgi:uncharacterized membrane protein YfcA